MMLYNINSKVQKEKVIDINTAISKNSEKISSKLEKTISKV